MQIGNLSLNLDFYKGEAPYSDGDIENTMLDMARRRLSYEQAIAENDSWPVVYHFSPVRKNLLDWYAFPAGCSVLEIGAGCGAVTGVLCEKAGRVVANELTKRRAEILANRHQDATNLEVIVGNLSDIEFNEQFDIVTLIGVLEYAKSFTDSERPYDDFLQSIWKLVKPGGKLLVAIENRYGLKYWSGAPEDHTSKFFDSIEGYVDGGVAQTFSRQELEDLLHANGFSDAYFYYPHPDYKMPLQIFCDDRLPSPGQIEEHVPQYDSRQQFLFREDAVWTGIVENGQYPFFANSFLVDCRARGEI